MNFTAYLDTLQYSPFYNITQYQKLFLQMGKIYIDKLNF